MTSSLGMGRASATETPRPISRDPLRESALALKPASRVSKWPYLAMVGAIATVYFGAAKLGLTMAFVAEQVTVVWPPTGIALSAILLLGFRVWPGIWLGAFVANATAHEPLATAAGIATGKHLGSARGGVAVVPDWVRQVAGAT